jgi:putative hemolysin
MLELARIPLHPAGKPFSDEDAPGLIMGLASTGDELESIQRLRYKVFTEEMGAVFPGAKDCVDADRLDPWCEHIMVKEGRTGAVVGTYRFLSPQNAEKAGGYYSESEFDLSGLTGHRLDMAEVGRSCTHADHRNGAVIMLLWSGVARLMIRGGYRYLLGCASVSLRDDGATAAEVWRKASELGRIVEAPKIVPLHRYPVERLDNTLPARVPPLIKGYFKLGACVCGEPAWDPDFNTADFPILLDMTAMDSRYRRHFGFV